MLLELNRRSAENEKGGEPILKRASELVPPQKKSAYEYQPDSPFLRRVTVSDWPSRYTFYARFRENALREFDQPGEEAPFVPFFSYLPQFSQMKPEQIAFYRYFRSMLCRGTPIPADTGYLLLYLYELINLPEKYPPETALEKMCTVWLTYRKTCPKLDRYLGEWITDLCLIHRLPCPREALSPIVNTVLRYASLKEFFLGGSREDAYFHALFSFESEYNFFASKYITPENKHLFEEHIPNAFYYACRKLSEKDGRFSPRADAFAESVQVRDAFSAALCAFDVKKKIEVVYLAYQRTGGLRPLVTDMIKFAENCLRRSLGIRAKMSTLFLDAPMKEAIGEYFALHVKAPEKKKEKAPEVSEFEALYQPRETVLSVDSALSIEKASWSEAEKLVEGFDSYQEEQSGEKVPAFPERTEEKQSRETGETDEALLLVRQALALILGEDEEALDKLAGENLMMKETLIECVNEYCYDLIGDVAIVNENGKTKVDPTYREEICQCLKE